MENFSKINTAHADKFGIAGVSNNFYSLIKYMKLFFKY